MKLLLLSILLFSFSVCAQESTDSSYQHSVKKAIIFSAVVPGSGQVYNHIHMPKGKKKAYWKVPLIYGALGTTGYYFLHNRSLQKNLRTEYTLRQEELPGDPLWEPYDDQGVLTLYNQHRNRQDLFLLGFILVYAIQIADAGVEAHFVDFDISEDLSLSVTPYSEYYSSSYGLTLKLNFR